MKTLLITAAFACLGLYSCKKTEIPETFPTSETGSVNLSTTPAHRNLGDSMDVPTTKTVNFYTPQHADAGDVIISNDGEVLFITITMQNGFALKQSNIYIGVPANAPINNSGNADPGQFPYHVSFNSGVATYTLQVPLNNLPDCFTVMVNGNVKNGNMASAWAEGPLFGGSNEVTYVEYCKLTTPE